MVPRLMNERRDNGFTLIELLIVVVILGVLASIAMPRLDDARARAHFTSIVSDFRHLSQVQEHYFQMNMSYAEELGVLEFTPTQGVVVTVTEASAQGWSATGTHVSLAEDQGCSIFLGTAVAPALPNGQPHGGVAGTADCAR